MLMLMVVGCAPGRGTSQPTPAPTATDDIFYAPDFTLSTLDGGSVTLSDLRGEWVVVNWWATWCAPCVEEMPALEALAESGVARVVGINQGEDPEAVGAFLAAHGINSGERYRMGVRPAPETVLAYNVYGLPQTDVIAPDGELVRRFFGPVSMDEVRAEIER